MISCGSDPVPFNCAESDLSLQFGNVVTATGCDVSDGSITVIASGGEAPYQFSINNLPSQASASFSTLKAGIYSVTVIDANKCDATLSNINVPATGFIVSADVEADNLCLDGDGIITITVDDGQSPPYQYQLESGTFSDNNVFTGLQKGNHRITVKDNSNCTVQLNITVPHGNTGTSWTSEILPIVETKCAAGGCHDGQYRPDLRLYEKAFFYRDLMRKYTQDKSMPFDGPALTQSQIDLIACWVDDGAPQN
jgi:hypothetical protein